MLLLLLIILLIVLSVGTVPQWGYHTYGYAPSSVVLVLAVVLIVLILTGRL
jgi:hypothetical protein